MGRGGWRGAVGICAWALATVAGVEGQTLPEEVRTTVGGVRYRLEPLLTDVVTPSALAFLPDGRLLLAERREGRLSVVDVEAAHPRRTPVHGLPDIYGERDAGLHDVLVDPEGRLYLSWTEGEAEASALVVARGRLEGTRLVDLERLFRAEPARDTAFHYGGRMALHEGHLFVTVGDHHHRHQAQDPASHLGSVVRLREDGSVPGDNPWAGRPGALPELWSVGHRNAQGMAVDPASGALWISEHGPLGGDELNRVRRGANYGWPRVTWGREYAGGPVGDGATHGPGLEQPAWVFPHGTAPSDLLFYRGDAFPAWRGSLFSGAMGAGTRRLDRLVLEEGRVLHHEPLLEELDLRVRAVAEGPDGLLYVGTDQGLLFRIRPG